MQSGGGESGCSRNRADAVGVFRFRFFPTRSSCDDSTSRYIHIHSSIFIYIFMYLYIYNDYSYLEGSNSCARNTESLLEVIVS